MTRPDLDPIAPFDADLFRARGHGIVDLLADHLAALSAAGSSSIPVLPWKTPEDQVASWPMGFDAPEDFLSLLRRVVDASNHLHHPRYIGHQVTSPFPSSALLELASAFLNNGSAVYEMGPASIAMERQVLRWLGGHVGFGVGEGTDGVEGVLTSGGSAGNLTALLAMRQARAGFDAWGSGAHGGPPLAVLASDQTHYCVRRAVQIMGWGDEGVVVVPTDDAYRLRADALDEALARGEKAGRRIVGVVASASSTSTGAIDPLEAVADFCGRRDLWMHVDGAHGASFALSPRLRPRLAGIEKADSLVWDAHKMMLVPAVVTAVLFRDGRRSYEAFSQEASYLFAGTDPRRDWFDVGTRTLECTKNMMGFRLYGALAIHGAAYFASYVERMVDLAAAFADRLREEPDFELGVVPDGNIVCFRYTGGAALDAAARDALQSRIRARILERGTFYLVQTGLRTGTHLRTTLINPRTTEADLVALLDEVRTVASEISRQ